jgi:hypothetical protein
MRFMAAGMHLIHSARTLIMGLIFVSYRNARFRKVPNVRIRGIPEAATCLVFTPDNPEVYTLTSTAWLILHLCDGRSEAKIAQAFHAAVEPMLSPEEARRAIRVGVESLMQNKIVEIVRDRGKAKTTGGKHHHEQKASAK